MGADPVTIIAIAALVVATVSTAYSIYSAEEQKKQAKKEAEAQKAYAEEQAKLQKEQLAVQEAQALREANAAKKATIASQRKRAAAFASSTGAAGVDYTDPLIGISSATEAATASTDEQTALQKQLYTLAGEQTDSTEVYQKKIADIQANKAISEANASIARALGGFFETATSDRSVSLYKKLFTSTPKSPTAGAGASGSYGR